MASNLSAIIAIHACKEGQVDDGSPSNGKLNFYKKMHSTASTAPNSRTKAEHLFLHLIKQYSSTLFKECNCQHFRIHCYKQYCRGFVSGSKTGTTALHTEILKAAITNSQLKKMTYLINTSEPSYSIATNNCNSLITNWL